MKRATVLLTGFNAEAERNQLTVPWAQQLLCAANSWVHPKVGRIRLITSANVSRHLGPSTFGLSNSPFEVVELTSEPMGALATATLGVQGMNPDDGPLIVAPGDTEVSEGLVSHLHSFNASARSAGVLVFPAEDSSTEWSFAHVDEESKQLLQVTEREEPSKFGNSGVFLFKDVGTFIAAAEWCFVNQICVRGTYFTSSTVNYLLTRGESVYLGEINRNSFQKLGRKL